MKVLIGLGVFTLLAAACAGQVPASNTTETGEALPTEQPPTIEEHEESAQTDHPE